MLLVLIVVIMLYSFADITFYDVVSLGVGHVNAAHSFGSDRIVDIYFVTACLPEYLGPSRDKGLFTSLF